MWIVDDDGDMFNTDHYMKASFHDYDICLHRANDCIDYFRLSVDLTEEERLTRYYHLVEELTGTKIKEKNKYIYECRECAYDGVDFKFQFSTYDKERANEWVAERPHIRVWHEKLTGERIDG